MVGFYKLSEYLNLMEGNIQQSISFYEQIPKELLEEDNYQLYFYALAKKLMAIIKGARNYLIIWQIIILLVGKTNNKTTCY